MILAPQLAAILKENLLELKGESGSIHLREGNTVMCVKIAPLPAPTAVIRIERAGHLPGLWDGPWKRSCDYLLIFEIGSASHAVFVELKKTSTGEQNRRSNSGAPCRFWNICAPPVGSSMYPHPVSRR